MHRRVEQGMRLGGIGLACVLYACTGLITCSGHAGYFRKALMERAECAGTSLDFLTSALAVVVAWFSVESKKDRRLWLLVLLGVLFLSLPACAAMVNCT
jgi:hypothetical protein